MRLTGSRTYSRPAPVPKMPPGLVELMEGLAKDVLRNNPTEIYEFCANHLEKLIELRDGPSRKKKISLEEKIAEAQKKVRQRAKERQQRYKEVENATNLDQPGDVESNDGRNSSQFIHYLRAPVHHEQDLSHASEVEISYEPSTDNSLTSKEINEADNIPISKSSTVSSISKSTVIDLRNEHETYNGEEVENVNESMQVNEEVDEQKDNISNDENTAASPNNETRIQEDESLYTDSIDQNDFREEALDKPYEDTTATEIDVTMKVEKETENESSADPISVNIESKNYNEISSSDDVKTNAEIKDSPQKEFVHDSELITSTEVTEHNTKNITPLDEDDAKIDNFSEFTSTNNQPDEVKNMESLTDKPLEQSLENLPFNIIITNTKSSVDDYNGNSDTNQVSDEEHVNVVEERSVFETVEMQDIDKNENVENNRAENITNSNDILKKSMLEKEGHPASGENNNQVETEKRDIVIKIDDNEHPTNDDNKKNENTEKKYLNLEDDSKKVDEEVVEKKHACTIANTNDGDNITTPRSKSKSAEDEGNNIESDLPKSEDDVSRSGNGQNDMNLETAAVTIQKVFRSFLFKSRNSTFEDITNDDGTSLEDDSDKKEEYYAAAAANLGKERRPLGITRMDTVLQTVNEEKSLSLSTDDSSTLSSAATTIQAHVRGYLVRNRLNSSKTVSTNSLVNSNEILDTDSDQKSKTVLNIHIVPEQANYLSRDESLITSMDLSLDGSPPSSINLHPLGYDLVSERRKLLKREDAIQSVSPPSNNSGKLSEDSVKEVIINENDASVVDSTNNGEKEDQPNTKENSGTLLTAVACVTVDDTSNEQVDLEKAEKQKCPMSPGPDESDVVTPFSASPRSLGFENTPRLLHSGEFHDVVLPTKVSRGDTTVVSEFKNVLAYILLWNAS